MKLKSIYLLFIFGFLFLAGCSDKEVTETDTKNYINAEQFFKKNRLEPAKVAIDGDTDIDIIISGLAPDIDGDGDIDIIITGLAPDIDGDGDIDIIISGYTKTNDNTGGLLVSETETKQLHDFGDLLNITGRDKIQVAAVIPKDAEWTWKDGGISSMDDWEAPPFIKDIDFEIGLYSGKNNFIFSGTDTQTEDGSVFDMSLAFFISATYKNVPITLDSDYLDNGGTPIKLFFKSSKGEIKGRTAYFKDILSDDKMFEDGYFANNSTKWEKVNQRVIYTDATGLLSFDLKDLGLVAIGNPAYDSTPNPIDIVVNVEGAGTSVDIVPWLIVDGGNIQQRLAPLSLKGNLLSSSTKISVPEGRKAELLLLGKNKTLNRVVLGKKKITLSKSQTIDFKVEK